MNSKFVLCGILVSILLVTVTLVSGTFGLQTYAASRPHIDIPKAEPFESVEKKAPAL